MIDVVQQIAAIEREVGRGQLPAGEARVARLSRTYDAAIDDVWDALTSPERIGRWFMPVSGDFRLGGQYQLEGNAGGRILACERPNRLAITWEYGEVPSEGAASTVELRLTPVGESTRLELVHTAIVPDEMWDQFGPGAVGVGWDGGMLGLALHLATDADMPEDKEAWQLSDEGRDWSTRSSAAWGDASRAQGVDDETVARYVANTTAFYTGVPVA